MPRNQVSSVRMEPSWDRGHRSWLYCGFKNPADQAVHHLPWLQKPRRSGCPPFTPSTIYPTIYPGRDAWFAGSAIVDGQRIGPPLGVRSLAANSTGSILFANVHVGGIARSTDGGRSWHPTIDINSDVHEVCAAHTNPEIVVAAAAIGLCISRDAGKTWAIEKNGLHDAHCYAVAISGDDVLISAAKDPFAAPGRVYRKTLELDGSLKAVEGGLPKWTAGMVDTACIATRGSYVAVADRGGNLYGSDDFGQTWSCRGTGLPPPSGILFC